MLRNTILTCWYYFSFLSANEGLPELIFRSQEPLEAFSFIEYLANRLPWFKENGYNIALPIHPDLELLYENPQKLSENEKNDLRQIFVTQVYNKSSFGVALFKLRTSKQLINEGLHLLSTLAKNWAFCIKEKYNIVVTLYGPGGNYDPASGKILLLTTEKGEFRKKCIAETILHEIVHIGIEESIVRKYKLLHWEKERLVDLICFHCFTEILPEYQMQQKGEKIIDDFVDQHIITHNLPSAIANFVQHHPR